MHLFITKFKSQNQNSSTMFDFKRIISSESNVKIHTNCKSCVDCLVVTNLALVYQVSNKQQCQNYNLIKKEIVIFLIVMCGYSFIRQHLYSMTVSQCTVIQVQSKTMVSGKGEYFSSFLLYLMKSF